MKFLLSFCRYYTTNIPIDPVSILDGSCVRYRPEGSWVPGRGHAHSQRQGTRLNPVTPMSDQDRISPYNINIISNRKVMREKKKYQSGDYKLIQYQILQTDIIRTVWQTVRRITSEIMGVKGFILFKLSLRFLL